MDTTVGLHVQSHTSATTGQPRRGAAGLPYFPALDGIRALAVIAVLFYHAGLNIWGGFLGVESFFVLSGFLITALLRAEWQQSGRVDLRAFWMRRARRLLPALFLMLAGTVVLANVVLDRPAVGLRDDILAALGYVMNWRLVLSNQSYFDPSVRPPLLQNLWSLAVEEQFYFAWPLLFIAGMRFLRPAGLLLATIATAFASALLMALLYQPGFDPSRIYYGTDTRVAGLLLGAALAMVWAPWRDQARPRRGLGPLLDTAGLLAGAGLISAYLWLYEYHPLLYRGGFAMTAFGTAVVVAASTHPRACLVPAILGWRPLRWIGQRSYGIYLWHWPIFIVTQPYRDVPIGGWPLVALRLAIVGAVAALSYRFVELPARGGAIGRGWRTVCAGWRTFDRGRVIPSLPLRWLRFPVVSTLLLFTATCSSLPDPVAGPAAPSAATVTPQAGDVASSAPPTTTPALSPTVAPATGLAPATAVAPPAGETAPTTETTPADTPPAGAVLEPFHTDLAAELQHVLDDTVADGTIPGAVLAVNIAGHETWLGAAGIANRSDGRPMEPGMNVRIASLSKMFTAVVVLQLVQEGKIGLDQTIDTWMGALVPDGNRITVRHLLSHTSGLYDYLEDRRLRDQVYQGLNRTWTPEELVGYAVQFPPSFQAGAEGQWDYSSTNYVTLGMIVERATGNTLAQEMRRRIFDPLQLEYTFFAPDEAVQGVEATGYSGADDMTDVSMSFAYATANIVSTVDDVQRFSRALHDGQLLGPETLAAMYSFVSGNGSYNMPDLEYGLGIMRNRLPVGPRPDGSPRDAAASTAMGHIGGYAGFRASVWTAPDSGITIALGVNQAATDPNELATKVWDVILTGLGR